MEGIDVASNIFTSIKNHPKILVPQLVYLIIIGIAAAALIIPPLASVATSINSTAQTTPSGTAVIGLLASAISQLIPSLIILVIIGALFGVILQAMYTDMASKWKNNDFSLSDSFGVALSRFVDLFIYTIILTVIELVIVLILFSPTIAALYKIGASGIAPQTTQLVQILAGALVSVLLGIIVAIILAPLLLAAPAIIVIEKKGAIAALKSSIDLGKKDFFGILGVLVIAACVYAVFYVLIILVDIIPYIGVIITLILSIILSSFLYSVAPMYYITFGQQKLNPAAAPKTPAPTTRAAAKRAKGKK